MSADNAVVVLRTTRRDSFRYEYRVSFANALDHATSPDALVQRQWMLNWFRASLPYYYDPEDGESAEERAWKAALLLANEVRQKSRLEHGIRSIRINQPFHQD
jgi:hypothetical protein